MKLFLIGLLCVALIERVVAISQITFGDAALVDADGILRARCGESSGFTSICALFLYSGFPLPNETYVDPEGSFTLSHEGKDVFHVDTNTLVACGFGSFTYNLCEHGAVSALPSTTTAQPTAAMSVFEVGDKEFVVDEEGYVYACGGVNLCDIGAAATQTGVFQGTDTVRNMPVFCEYTPSYSVEVGVPMSVSLTPTYADGVTLGFAHIFTTTLSVNWPSVSEGSCYKLSVLSESTLENLALDFLVFVKNPPCSVLPEYETDYASYQTQYDTQTAMYCFDGTEIGSEIQIVAQIASVYYVGIEANLQILLETYTTV